MMRSGKLLPVGVVVEVIGLVLLTAGVVGMLTWPMPGWASAAFAVGMTLTILGAFPIAHAMTHRAMRTAMSAFDGAGPKSGSGGLFGMINDLAGGNRDLLVNGVPATAAILSMSDTGMTVNDLPMVAFDLEVRREGAGAYRVAHRESMPRLLVGAILPGARLPVRVDPSDHNRLTIDWQHAAEYASPPAGQRVSAADILARGVPAMVTVLGTFSTNGMTADNGDPILGLLLRVTGPHGSYEVRLAHRVPPHHLARVHPDARFPAKIAPEDPEKVAIDWDQVHPIPHAQSL
ncbi:hypothetical protein [Nonomuraea basaltis]|uniref:hypothetical protein n=1 Tax=Nonomuraea basaltis TaxID=2495887 RepID=UPI00110C5BE5|nr:hypothetical protein [Nonomuraea basaltis]TMR99874.1 hypothetical protein EJK15_05000 [Nonomuraea basaltis]